MLPGDGSGPRMTPCQALRCVYGNHIVDGPLSRFEEGKMNAKIQKLHDQVRDALDRAGEKLSPAEWKELLEELSADIEGHLEAVKEENPELV